MYTWLNEDEESVSSNVDECEENETEDNADDDDQLEFNALDAFISEELPEAALGKMNHIKCSAHLLDKLGSVDALEAREKCAKYAEIFDRVNKKLSALWKIKESRQKSEYFKETTGKSITIPHRIRWLATHEAVSVTFFYISFFAPNTYKP